MTLQAAYKQFLAEPNSSFLASDASLHYITSTTSYKGATDIIKHLATLRKQIKRNKEDLLNVVEGGNSIAAEVEASLEFVTSGGPYLPGLDDNFLADRKVSLLMVHIVTFDSDGKIAQIRQTWDQGSLLKQLDIIGKSGRNWPIRDSKDQIALLGRSLGAHGGASAGPTEQQLPSRPRASSSNPLRDPHATLSLFTPREEVDDTPDAVVSPYAGNRPQQRSLNQILGDEAEDDENDEAGGTSPSRGRSRSSSKAIAPKIGAGKNFAPPRLFEGAEDVPFNPDAPKDNQSPDRFYRPHPKKFEHFQFADGSDPQDAPKPASNADNRKSKHGSNWSFEDFNTPQKPSNRQLHRTQDVRHWGNTQEENIEQTPVSKNTIAPAKARRDAEAHFEMQDDGFPPDGPRIVRPRGTGNTKQGLYKNNLYNEDGTVPTPGPQALDTVTNLKDRHKDFQPHFAMTDDLPAQDDNKSAPGKVGESRQKAVNQMASNWDSYDKSPAAQKENTNPTKKAGDERGIVIAGDGMGGRKGAGRGWAIGDDNDDEQVLRPTANKKQPAAQAKSSFWDF